MTDLVDKFKKQRLNKFKKHQREGLRGEDGKAGVDGTAGLKGPQGPIGERGPVGPRGDTGDLGPTGRTGMPGASGDKGHDGIQGSKGEIGLMPKHQFRGDALRFEMQEGTWGSWINLKDGVFSQIGGSSAAGAAAIEILDEGSSLTLAPVSMNFVGNGAVASAVGDTVTVTITDTDTTDHGAFGGLGDDDHAQYALLAGRAGGQTLSGSPTTAQSLTLRGSSGADSGFINMLSAVQLDYDTFSDSQQFAMVHNPTVSIDAFYIGGVLQAAATHNVTTGVYVPATFSDTTVVNFGAVPSFAAFTFINELATIQNSGNFNLPSALVMNVGLTHSRITAGTSTTPFCRGLSFTPQTRATVAGAVMTKTDQIAVTCKPSFSTVAGSTVNLGTVIGLEVQNPGVALFQPSAGVENITANIGLRMNGVTFGGASRVVNVIQTNLAAATNVRVINATGTAQSSFGGTINMTADLAGINFGASGDCFMAWAGPTNSLFMQFSTANGDQLHISNPSNGRLLFQGGAGVSTVDEVNFNFSRFSLGAQAGAVGNQVGVFVAPTRTAAVGGEWSDFLLTQAGNITLNAAMGLVAGWTINSPSITLGTGTVTTGCGLNIGGNPNQGTNRVGLRIISNPSGGGGINAALWITAGLSRFDGRVDINNAIALGGGAAATLGTIGATGPTAAAQATWVEIDVGGVAHWIPAWT